MDEKRTSETGKEDESSKQGQTGGGYQPGQSGQGGSTDKPGQSDPGIQPGVGESESGGNDWNKEPGKGTPESES